MIGNILAKRYAKALMESLKKEEVIGARKAIENLNTLLQSSREMRRLFLSPVFSLEEKKGVINALSEKIGFSKASQKFFDLLIEKDRLRYFKEIKNYFETLLYERENKVRAYVISSDSFSPSHQEELKTRLKDITRKEIDLDIKSDPAIIGGLVVRIGDVIYDGSIKGQLTNIREELLERISAG